MVKIFIGNLASDTTAEEIRELFQKYGKVTECDVVKDYGFVHMSNKSEAEEAIKNLDQYQLHGWSMNVEMSKGRPRSTTKLHVSNLGESVSSDVLRAKFEAFGTVVECDIVKDYAFVHMERMEDAMEAINKLDNTAFKGKLMNVQLSTSRLRTAPGMGDHNGCFVCGKHGHWSKDCPMDRNGNHGDGSWGRGSRGTQRGTPSYSSYEAASPSFATEYGSTYGSTYSRGGYASAPPPPPPPPRRPAAYSSDPYDRYGGPAAAAPHATDRSSAYDPHRLYNNSVNYYEQQRARYYGSSYGDERRTSYAAPPPPPPPPPPPSSSSYSYSYSYSKLPSTTDPYSRRPVAPSAPTASSSYYARDYSALRQIPTTPSSYSHERTRLSPASSAPRTSYSLPPSKDHYAARYAPY